MSDKLKIGDVVKKIGEDGYYIITSEPWIVGGNMVVKITPVPDDGLYAVEECRGCIRVDVLEKIKNQRIENE